MIDSFQKEIKFSNLLKSPMVWAAYFFGIISVVTTTILASIAGPAFKIIKKGVPVEGVDLSNFGPLVSLFADGVSYSQHEFYRVFPVALLMIGVIKFACQWLHNLIALQKGEKVSHAIRQNVLQSFFSGRSRALYSPEYQDEQKSILQFFGKEFRDIMQLITNVFIGMPVQILLAAALLALLLYISPTYLGVVLIAAPCFALILRYFRKRIPTRQQGSLEASSDTLNWLQKRMQGIETIKHHGTEEFESGKFKAGLETLKTAEIRLARTESKLNPIIEWLAVFAAAILLGVVLALRTKYPIDTEVFFGFLACLAILGQVIGKISRQYNHLLRASVAAKRLATSKKAFETETKKQPISRSLDQHLKIEGLSLTTPNEEPIVSNITAQFEPGKLHAVLGASGVGKSTLMNALSGNWPWTSSGRIDLAKSILNVRYLPQKFVLGPQSVKQHLSGRDLLSVKQLKQMLTCAETKEIPKIQKALESDEFMLDIWQKKLSGGEHQRISMSRIMRPLPNELVLMDEGFSALPPDQERRLLTKLKEFVQGSSIYIFSMHSLANIDIFDHVWELKKKELSEWKP